MLAVALGIAAALTPVFVVMFPDVAVHHDGAEGAWRGMFGFKNNLGLTMALGVLVLLPIALERSRRRLPAMIGLGLCICSLVMSQSATAWLVAVLLSILTFVLRRFRVATPRIRAQGATLAIAAICAAVIPLITSAGDIAGLLGRDLTLSERTDLWSAAVQRGLERPLFGYGYRAFWSGGTQMFVASHAWISDHGHNGYLDLWLELGIAGVGLFATTLAVGLFRLTRGRAWRLDPQAATYPVLILFVLFVSIPYSQILAQNSIAWVLYIIVLGYLSPSSTRIPATIAPHTDHRDWSARNGAADAAASPVRRPIPASAASVDV
jgi:O-antigen ligase